MSMSSDSDSGSSRGGGFKNFRHITRDRLLNEMLKSNSSNSKSWKVFIMDKVTVKIMSSSCNMSDVTAEGISLVEDLFRRRQPMPSMDAIYFIQPSKENVIMFMSDMSGREPLYRKAFVYFSTPVPKDLVNHIKKDVTVVPRIGALSEMNLEFFPVDGQVFVTDHGMALAELYGESAKNSRKFNACLNTMATRIATVFASLKELPNVRYQAPKNLDSATCRDLVPLKLAAAVGDHIKKYRSNIPDYPQKETCELLILDRSVDQIAPVMHEWTYDAMCHDLLETDGNKLVLEVNDNTSRPPERKEVLLEDSDPVWLEIRHMHIAEASERLHDRMANFTSKNKAAQLSQASRDGAELSTSDLQKIVEALPKYTEQIAKLSLHVEIAGKINKIIRDMGLRDLGQLEQDIVFGDAGTKELITFLRANQDASVENKLRLLMIYASVHPDQFEGDRASKLMQLAKLSSENMKAIQNMRLLAESSNSQKKSSGTFSLKFDGQKKKVSARKDRTTDEGVTWALSKFYPTVEELIENIDKDELSKSDYNFLNEPSQGNNARSQRTGTTVSTTTSAPPRSVRSKRTTTWGRSQHSDDGSSDSVLRHASSDFKVVGSRIFIFIIGGATRSEIRACYKLTNKLKREIILGATSIDDPPQYITKLKLLSEDLCLDGLNI